MLLVSSLWMLGKHFGLGVLRWTQNKDCPCQIIHHSSSKDIKTYMDQ